MSTTRSLPIAALGQCACSGKNLDRFIQPAVLAILAQGPIHGYRLVQRLKAMPTFARRQPDAAGVYRYLKVMEDGKLVRSAWDLSAGGPARRLFDLLPRGRACLARWVATLEDYQEQIGQLVQALRPAAKPAPRRACRCSRPRGVKG